MTKKRFAYLSSLRRLDLLTSRPLGVEGSSKDPRCSAGTSGSDPTRHLSKSVDDEEEDETLNVEHSKEDDELLEEGDNELDDEDSEFFLGDEESTDVLEQTIVIVVTPCDDRVLDSVSSQLKSRGLPIFIWVKGLVPSTQARNSGCSEF